MVISHVVRPFVKQRLLGSVHPTLERDAAKRCRVSANTNESESTGTRSNLEGMKSMGSATDCVCVY